MTKPGNSTPKDIDLMRAVKEYSAPGANINDVPAQQKMDIYNVVVFSLSGTAATVILWTILSDMGVI